METFKSLFKQLPDYYKAINIKDPLLVIIFSIQTFIVALLMVTRHKIALQLLILFSLLVIIVASQQIHILLSTNQPRFLEEKLISMRYFDDEGLFVVFVIIFPIFIICILFTIRLIIIIIINIRAAQRDINQFHSQKEQSKQE